MRLRLAGRGITLTEAAERLGTRRGKPLARENLARALRGEWRGPQALMVIQAVLQLAWEES